MSRIVPVGDRGAQCASLCVLASWLLLPAIAASSSNHRLVDGFPAPPVPRALQGYDGVTMTRARTGTVASMHGLISGCPEARQAKQSGQVVERVGVRGRSVTFVVGQAILAGCDRNPSARASYGRWCGTSGWNLVRRRVSDPRLDLCYDGHGRPVIAFGWINPVSRAKWIVIGQPGYREVYPVAAGLPVRVSTVSGLGGAGGAVFQTSQYDAAGVLLVRRKVVAAIAS